MDPRVPDLFNRYGPRLQKLLGSRLVSIVYLHARNEPITGADGREIWHERPEFKTGFLIEFDNEWFVATAGHVIEEMKRFIDAGRQIVSISLFAGYDRDDGTWDEIKIEAKTREYAHDPKTQEDVGLMSLTIDERIRLVKAGCDAFTPEQWGTPKFKPQLFVVAGFPKDVRDLKPAGKSVWNAQNWPLLPLLPISHDYRAKGELPHFRGVRVGDSKTPLDSTNGMSGGPIIAIEIVEEKTLTKGIKVTYNFALMAIQGFENTDGDQRIVGGSYVKHLIKLHRVAKGLKPLPLPPGS